MRKSLRLGLFSILAATASYAADTYSWGNVAFEGGGFVSAVIPSKTQKDLVYTRTDVGGAYRWDATSGRWTPLMDWLNEKQSSLFGTEALALDPNDPAKLYILGGISYFNGGKTAILRSSDYGATFDIVDVTTQFKAHGNGMGRQTGERLAVDPKNSNILYCGTRLNGLFRSIDAGKTWTSVPSTSSLGGSDLTADNGISYVLFDSTSGTANGGTKTVYLGVSKTTGSFYKSTDGGATFAKVDGAPAQMAMRAVFVDGVIYGTFSSTPGPHSIGTGSVWKYATGTGVWTNISPKAEDGTVFGSGQDGAQYGFGGITVDSKNHARMVVSSLSCYRGANIWPDGKSNAGDMFFFSEDAGASWKFLNPYSNTTPNLSPNGNNWISGSSIHWAGSVEFDPFNSKVVWSTSGNGVFRTDDISAATPVWKFQSKGIEETVPAEVVSVPGGPLVTAIYDYDGATYDNIGVTAPTHSPFIGSDPSLGYAAVAGDFIRSSRVTDYGKTPALTYDVLYHSTDMGRTWTATDTASLPGSGGNLAMSADGRVFLLRPKDTHTGTNSAPSTFYRSADKGKTWTAVTGLSTMDGRMLSDPVNSANFYIVPDGYTGDVYASSDTGKTFSKISKITPKDNQTPASNGLLRAAPGVAGDLWLCLDSEQPWTTTGYSSNGLGHSTDGGKTWSFINTMEACITMGLGKAAPGSDYFTLYMWGKTAGNPLGIYRSIDKGQTWLRINDDQHQYGGPGNGKFVVGDFNTYGRVYMSTAGRGIVYGNIGALDPTSTKPRTFRPGYSSTMQLQGSQLLVQTQGLRNPRLEIFDLSGHLLLSSTLLDGTQQISLASMPRGFCVARILSGNGVIASKQLSLLANW